MNRNYSRSVLTLTGLILLLAATASANELEVKEREAGLGTKQTITSAGVKGVDHAFVLIGDLKKDPFHEIVVVDPWVTKAQPLLYSDFVFQKKRSEIESFDVAPKLSKEKANETRQARRALTRELRKSLRESPHPLETKTVGRPGELPGIWNQYHSARYKFRYLVRDGKNLKRLRLTSTFTKIYPPNPAKIRRSLWQKITGQTVSPNIHS